MSMLFPDQNFMFFPMVHFVFAVSLILCTGKWIKLVTETDLAFNLYFQQLGLNLQENKVHHSKEREMPV
jgi:hypothetical protein